MNWLSGLNRPGGPVWSGSAHTLILESVSRLPFPKDFQDLEPTDKLVWLYIALLGEGEYSARSLGDSLGVDKNSAGSALSRLAEKGLLVRLRPAVGRRAGLYGPATDSVAPDTHLSVPFETFN